MSQDFLSQNWQWVLAIALWSLPWKGVALWKAVGLRDKAWFIVLLVVNTVGVLDIIYIFVIARRKKMLDRAFSS
ncbi:MAG: DUF5652 family protein [Candidatus Liptonbacteria bacterium]|nr:DUF5652 family protein [Candidatus Liptonbacteria bacterium]